MTIKYLDSKRISGLSADKIIPNSNRGTVTTDGSYTVITFTSDGTFTPESSFNVEYLIVAGGGGGGMNNNSNGGGAGGGAGEMLESTSTNLTAGNYSVVVGTGGVGGTGVQNGGTKGIDSTWNSLTAEGGGTGAGARESDSALKNGGSGGSGGGGSPIENGSGGTGGTSQTGGNDGANATSNDNTNMRAGNGGGAGSAGVDSTGGSGSGGNGKSNSITGSAVNYASGGTGGWYFGMNTSASNTGVYGNGGVGRAGNAGSGGSAGTGGNGVVILRFLTSGNTYETGTPTGGFPTNVQDNSILVIKDTGRRYWGSVIGDTGLKAYYKFNASSGNIENKSTSSDTIGSSGDMAITGATSVTGIIGNALSFDGTNDYGNIPTSPMTTIGTGDFGISFWVKTDDFAGGGAPCIMGSYDASSAGGDHWQLYESGGAIKLSDGSTTITTSITGIEDNAWHHIVLTRSGSTVTAYKDGSSVSTHTYAVDFPSPSTYLRIAQRGDSNQYCDAELDELSFWNRTLTGTDVTALYNSGGGKAVGTATWTWDYVATRGVFAGANANTIMDYITIDTLGNAIDFGDLTQGRWQSGGISSETRGVITGGALSGDVQVNTMDYVTIATTGNATDFGDLTTTRRGVAGVSNLTRGVTAGSTNVMDYITIATTGNAIDFGDLTISRIHLASVSSLTRGVFAGGGSSDSMDYITISTLGNAIDFGDLTVARTSFYGISSFTRGVFGGTYPTGNITMDYITIDTTGNASDFGDLTVARYAPAGVSSYVRGCFGGGYTNTDVNTIDYITIDTLGDAIDFGDLTVARPYSSGVQA